MRIAVASNGLEVSPYFECCSNFNYFTLEDARMVDYRNFPLLHPLNDTAIDILDELEIDIIIVGCLQKRTRTILESNGITVLCGAKGEAKQTVEDYMSDTFIACDGSCDEYQDASF